MTVPEGKERRWTTRGSDVAEMLLMSEWDLDKLRITMTGPSTVSAAEPETRVARQLLLEFGRNPITKPYLLFLDQFADLLHDGMRNLPGFDQGRRILRNRYGTAPGQLEAAQALSRVRRAVIWMEDE